jgi:hypothetical protein
LVIRIVFLVLHTPTTDGEAAQERFSEGTLVTDLVVLGQNFYSSAVQASQTQLAEPFEYSNSVGSRQPHPRQDFVWFIGYA